MLKKIKIYKDKLLSLYNKIYIKLKYIRFLIKQIMVDDIAVLASSLAYTTFVSLIPLLAVLFGVFSFFPTFSNLKEKMKEFVLGNLMPQVENTVEQYIESFISNATQTTVFGLCVLFSVALLLMRSIDVTLNKIWHSSEKRSRVTTFSIYWTMLTLGPLLIGISLALSSTIAASDIFGVGQIGMLVNSFGIRFMPTILIFIVLIFLFMVVPNVKVKFIHAVIGAFFSSLLQEIVKNLFTYFIVNFTSYSAIYGAVAVIPIIMVWMYINWYIVLLGAEISSSFIKYRNENNVSNIDLTKQV